MNKYGENIIQDLQRAKHITTKVEIAWLEEKILYYKEKVKEFGMT